MRRKFNLIKPNYNPVLLFFNEYGKMVNKVLKTTPNSCCFLFLQKAVWEIHICYK